MDALCVALGYFSVIRSQNVMNDREGGLRVEGISGVGFVGCTVTSASPVLPGTE